MEKKSDIKNEVTKSVRIHIDSLDEFIDSLNEIKEELDAINKYCSYRISILLSMIDAINEDILLSMIDAFNEELKRI